jgi:hypothetical protein
MHSEKMRSNCIRCEVKDWRFDPNLQFKENLGATYMGTPARTHGIGTLSLYLG